MSETDEQKPAKVYQSLAPGRYGDKKHAGLEIVMYNGAKPTKTAGLERHSFLVAALPNGESKRPEGTAFLTFNVDDAWLTEGVLALVFEDAKATDEQKQTAERMLYDQAVQKCVAANTPADKIEEAAKDQYDSILQQIQISVGTIYRLQDWDGEPRSTHVNFRDWEGLEFSGDITEREYQGKKSAEVRVLKHRVKHGDPA